MSGVFEIIDPRFKAFVLSNAPLETLGTGFRWLEGPVWVADWDCLIASDIPHDRTVRWTEAGGVATFQQPANFTNGHTRDQQGRLIACSHRGRCVTRLEPDGTTTMLATHYQGRRLNSPNDIICRSDGTIWFSDPHYGINTDYEGGKQVPELPPSLYCLDPADGSLTLVADDFEGPNGLCFSPDERLLYVAESGLQFAPEPRQCIRVFDVDNTQLRNGRHFHTIAPGFADGIRCDDGGCIWSSAGDGVHCIDPHGILLGKIKVPHTVANLAFGGRNRSRLFICASHTLYAIYTNRRGAARP